jgi:hypothetical protein
MAIKTIPIASKPGIKRDGTKFEGDYYVDGQWVRFQRGLPRKMAGYKAISNYLTQISRGMKTFTEDGVTYVHSGSAEFLERFSLDQNGNASAVVDRTPVTMDFNENNMWQFDVLYDSISSVPSNKIIGQIARNSSSLYNSVGGQVFYGDLRGLDRLNEVYVPPGVSASGGVCVLHPYLTVFGTDGSIGWSVPGDPSNLTGDGSGNARIAAQKIVRGLPLRGGPGNAPAGLYWSTDAVVRASFVGGSQTFQFDTISSQSSILSPASVIEYDGVYFWCGVDRFLMFNGVVRDVENNMNINYFFDGLNRAYSQRVFAFKVPRFGEIWWCYPRGNATECTHAVIYNVREQTWYDTQLPNGGRSAGEFVTQFATPLLTGVAFNTNKGAPTIRITQNNDERTIIAADTTIRITYTNDNYKFWQHEVGVDEVDLTNISAIQSYFETADISAVALQNDNVSMRCELLEPDFVQSGNMTVQIVGRANARSKEIAGELKTIVPNPSTPYEQVIFFKDIRREMRFRFESNIINGDYQMGQVIAHVETADGTVLGATN